MSSLILMLLPNTVIIDFSLPSLDYLKESISYYYILSGCYGDAHNGQKTYFHTMKLLFSNGHLTDLEKLKPTNDDVIVLHQYCSETRHYS